MVFASRGFHLVSSFILFGILLMLFSFATGGRAAGQGQPSVDQKPRLTVEVRVPDGSPLDSNAVVSLSTMEGSSSRTATLRNGRAQFDNLQQGRYIVEVIANGYQRLTEQVDLIDANQHEQMFVTLKPESVKPGASGSTGPPILAPNAQKELNKALEAIREGKPESARKHLENASRAAPSNPDVNYLWGVYYAQTNDWVNAKKHWAQAVQVYPRHASSLAGLAQIAMQHQDLPGAIDYYSRAAEATPTFWLYQERLAQAYLQNQEYEQAQKYAERAIELGKDRATRARLVLAKVQIQRKELLLATKTLETFIAAQPTDPNATEARRMLDAIRAPAAPQPLSVKSVPPDTGGNAQPASTVEDLVPPSKWMPPDTDESMPPVEAGVPCVLEKIQDEAGRRVREFVEAVNRISATESLENEVVDRSGLAAKRETRSFNYIALFQEIRPGAIHVEEYRDGTMALEQFPERVATLGLTSLVLIFHPSYRDDYEVTCEGLSRWQGRLAWQVHFRQRRDKPARIRDYRVNNQTFSVSLRGRAWIAADTFQVINLESDIVAPIPEIRLRAEHTSIEYAPVKFKTQQQELWLPQSVEIFFDYGGRRMHRRHHFADYQLFSVDEKEHISPPKDQAVPAAIGDPSSGRVGPPR